MARGTQNYPVPENLKMLGIAQAAFGGWLDRTTNNVVRRDRKRLSSAIRREVYRRAIYLAVKNGGDRDFYTGEPLDWRLLRYFSKTDGVGRDERQIPTVDHENLSTESPVFRICSKRTNMCKSNASVEELIEFCEAFLKYQKATSGGRNWRLEG